MVSISLYIPFDFHVYYVCHISLSISPQYSKTLLLFFLIAAASTGLCEAGRSRRLADSIINKLVGVPSDSIYRPALSFPPKVPFVNELINRATALLSYINFSTILVWGFILLAVLYIGSVFYPAAFHEVLSARNMQDFSTNVMQAIQDDNLKKIVKSITDRI